MNQSADQPARWPVAVAALLLVLAGGGLALVLPSGPPQPAPLVITDTAPLKNQLPTNGQVPPVDTAAAMATAEVKLLRKIPIDTTIRFSTHDPLADDTLAHPHTYRRYLGTLNGQAVVINLSVQVNIQVKSYMRYWAGNWYYRYARQPDEHQLLFQHQRGGQLVLAEEVPNNAPTTDTARVEWQFNWPLRRTLQGRRTAQGTNQQVVSLREDYSQATPYELLRLTARRHYWCGDDIGSVQPHFSTPFLHLRGADSVRLARWQAPPPSARRDSVCRALLSESCQQVSRQLDVTLNDYGLLSYRIWTNAYYYGAHPENDFEGFIVNLSTGEELLIEELLLPGTEPALLKLLTRHLRQDYPDINKGGDWHWKTVPPLPSSFTLTPTGLCADYGDYALTAYSLHYANTTTIPYRELRRLVRPGTPLARMLALRGLW